MENITKSYGEVKALVGADFTANRGEIHALLGENGAGKSTLVKILSRVARQDKGRITLFGSPLVTKSPDGAIKAGIGTVFQELSLVPVFTVAENVFFGRGALSSFGTLPNKVLNAKTAELLESYQVSGIDPKAEVEQADRVRAAGGRDRQGAGAGSQVLVLDEPTAGLSEDRVEWLLALMQQLAKRAENRDLHLSSDERGEECRATR